ncbi:uncharacterized protein LOC116110749 [Pistacia vera]|uniref:uncharacterized protein LOC116110749 n=1 Tax=Pistacia vera TaxID=55513 RepID=UPI001263B586|nr:uncharacterized protein LOC116110749 [Pistacia vera]
MHGEKKVTLRRSHQFELSLNLIPLGMTVSDFGSTHRYDIFYWLCLGVEWSTRYESFSGSTRAMIDLAEYYKYIPCSACVRDTHQVRQISSRVLVMTLFPRFTRRVLLRSVFPLEVGPTRN